MRFALDGYVDHFDQIVLVTSCYSDNGDIPGESVEEALFASYGFCATEATLAKRCTVINSARLQIQGITVLLKNLYKLET